MGLPSEPVPEAGLEVDEEVASSPTFPSLPLLSFLPSLPIEVGPLNPARDQGSTVSSPSRVWGAAPAEVEFRAF